MNEMANDLFTTIVNMQKSLTKVPVVPDRIFKIYQRESFRDNFISSSLMGGYMSHKPCRLQDQNTTPVPKKYL